MDGIEINPREWAEVWREYVLDPVVNATGIELGVWILVIAGIYGAWKAFDRFLTYLERRR